MARDPASTLAHPRWRSSATGATLAALALAMMNLGCSDPVREANIAALGPEEPAVRAGPLHRPGQPCVVCHSKETLGESVFSIAGTVYRTKGAPDPMNMVNVTVVDAAGRSHKARTNCAGNFWIRSEEFVPQTPYWVTLQLGEHSIDMETPVFREGSCAVCHLEPAGPSSAGAVYLTDDAEIAKLIPRTTCDR